MANQTNLAALCPKGKIQDGTPDRLKQDWETWLRQGVRAADLIHSAAEVVVP